MQHNHWKLVLLGLAAPALMAPDCGSSSSARFQGSPKEIYCNEDVPVSAIVSALPSSGYGGTGVLGLFGVDGNLRILRRVELNRGDSVVLNATIPWSDLSTHRGATFTFFADIALIKADSGVTEGSSLTLESYDMALGGTVSWLLARETLAFGVCK